MEFHVGKILIVYYDGGLEMECFYIDVPVTQEQLEKAFGEKSKRVSGIKQIKDQYDASIYDGFMFSPLDCHELERARENRISKYLPKTKFYYLCTNSESNNYRTLWVTDKEISKENKDNYSVAELEHDLKVEDVWKFIEDFQFVKTNTRPVLILKDGVIIKEYLETDLSHYQYRDNLEKIFKRNKMDKESPNEKWTQKEMEGYIQTIFSTDDLGKETQTRLPIHYVIERVLEEEKIANLLIPLKKENKLLSVEYGYDTEIKNISYIADMNLLDYTYYQKTTQDYLEEMETLQKKYNEMKEWDSYIKKSYIEKEVTDHDKFDIPFDKVPQEIQNITLEVMDLYDTKSLEYWKYPKESFCMLPERIGSVSGYHYLEKFIEHHIYNLTIKQKTRMGESTSVYLVERENKEKPGYGFYICSNEIKDKEVKKIIIVEC